jgi:hypothetical protein
MTGITAHEELTQRKSKTAQRVLRVHAIGCMRLVSAFPSALSPVKAILQVR